jgi:hypothetical protein
MGRRQRGGDLGATQLWTTATNNSGILLSRPVLEVTAAEMRAAFETNVFGTTAESG